VRAIHPADAVVHAAELCDVLGLGVQGGCTLVRGKRQTVLASAEVPVAKHVMTLGFDVGVAGSMRVRDRSLGQIGYVS